MKEWGFRDDVYHRYSNLCGIRKKEMDLSVSSGYFCNTVYSKPNQSLYVIKVILIVVKSNTTSPNETPCIVSIHLVLVLIECYPLCVD